MKILYLYASAVAIVLILWFVQLVAMGGDYEPQRWLVGSTFALLAVRNLVDFIEKD